ncbi:unnamed protein product [Cyclocybe aegerita]|uniref:F-box domain-containing protein n=1 Tax=Cyclocybe aegerita TaxID=1973307 RepID=A0A8S0X1U9_CYCAE|nr:unnamed protein product [Cyclocybe aegerita]
MTDIADIGSPILKLPEDVLRDIFAINGSYDELIAARQKGPELERVFDEPDTDPSVELSQFDLHPLTTIRRASQVCAFWRHIILHYPGLWGGLIDIEFIAIRSQQAWAEEILRRAGDSPLTVVGAVANRTPSLFRVLLSKLVTVHWSQIRLIDLDLGKCLGALTFMEKAISTHTECLEHFLLKYNFDFKHGAKLFDNVAPSLRSFWHHGLGFDVNAPWMRQLQRLSVQLRAEDLQASRLSDFLNALTHMFSLGSLEITNAAGKDPKFRGDVALLSSINLPQLKHLSITHDIRICNIILSHIAPTEERRTSVCVMIYQFDEAATLELATQASSYVGRCKRPFSPLVSVTLKTWRFRIVEQTSSRRSSPGPDLNFQIIKQKRRSYSADMEHLSTIFLNIFVNGNFQPTTSLNFEIVGFQGVLTSAFNESARRFVRAFQSLKVLRTDAVAFTVVAEPGVVPRYEGHLCFPHHLQELRLIGFWLDGGPFGRDFDDYFGSFYRTNYSDKESVEAFVLDLRVACMLDREAFHALEAEGVVVRYPQVRAQGYFDFFTFLPTSFEKTESCRCLVAGNVDIRHEYTLLHRQLYWPSSTSFAEAIYKILPLPHHHPANPVREIPGIFTDLVLSAHDPRNHDRTPIPQAVPPVMAALTESPISMLPEEVLRIIFSINGSYDELVLAKQDVAEAEERESDEPDTQPVIQLSPFDRHPLTTIRRASQVCMFWRNIILHYQGLWGGLLDIDYIASYGRVEWAEEILRRAGVSPLTVVGTFFGEIQTFNDNLNEVDSQSVHATVTAFTEEAASTPTKRLQHFSLIHRFDFESAKNFFSGSVPSLRTFSYGLGFDLNASWTHQLRSLSLNLRAADLRHGLLSDLLTALPHTRSLRSLKLSNFHSNLRLQGVDPVLPCIDLPQLSDLSIEANIRLCNLFLRHITPARGRRTIIHARIPSYTRNLCPFVDELAVHTSAYIQQSPFGPRVSFSLGKGSEELHFMDHPSRRLSHEPAFKLSLSFPRREATGVIDGAMKLLASFAHGGFESTRKLILEIGWGAIRVEDFHGATQQFLRAFRSLTSVQADAFGFFAISQAISRSERPHSMLNSLQNFN